MITAVITSRRDFIDNYNENRDSIDIKLIELLNECGISCILLPNSYRNFHSVINNINYEIAILSGGGSVINDSTECIDRIKIENDLIKISIQKSLKLIGICRGMQAIAKYFGSNIEPISGHVSTRHGILDLHNNLVEHVNSFHNYTIKNLSTELFDVIYKSDDDSIECIKHKIYKILGIMWHPEREPKFNHFDISLIKEFIK